MLLTKHEGVTFEHQTVYISGQAFVRCHFAGCTLVLRESVYHLDGCSFDRCNWHIDTLLPWGSPQGVKVIKELVALIEQGLKQIEQPTDDAAAVTPPAETSAPSPFV